MSDPTLTCPNCGYGFAALQRSTRMFDCPSCNTTLFREDGKLGPMGDHGEMHEVPMLFAVGDRVTIDHTTYSVIGHARFDYGRGWWDEMWAVGANGVGVWISIDEGDVVRQRPLDEQDWPRWQEAPPLGATFRVAGDEYRVTEADEAACIAIRGELPEILEIGERHHFVNASGNEGALLSGEFWPGGRAWFTGAWVDPWQVKVERA